MRETSHPSAARYRRASFLTSAHNLRQLPPDEGLEVAFAGRSNAGKSSAINLITGQRQLARTSKQPGRTQQIMFFRLDDERRLVDLPGYGFARVPLKVKRHWEQTLPRFLQGRESLQGVILVMDVRHPLAAADRQFIEWCGQAGLPLHILLTKADKLSRGAGVRQLREVASQLDERIGIQLFSSHEGEGLETVFEVLDRWLRYRRAEGPEKKRPRPNQGEG
ncbi:MAG: YihA family ribosome biogenesis GTP-binding protein [Gammaproteobacteria bacterium]|nr:MAG: YihA family ribosome biogenesis GTP-binding protein [Gammaproteobacteria bacterium]